MNQSRVAARYATALFEQAQQTNVLETVMSDAESLRTMIEDSRDLALFFQSPVIKSSQKAQALNALFPKMQLTPVMQNFLLLLVEKSRESEILGMLNALKAQYNAAKSLASVEVTSAFELDADQKTQLLKKIEEYIGKTPVANYRIDNALIGGFTVKIGDSIMDGSIKHQLTMLKKRLFASGAQNN
jgi:F-type H+-transporting ATPase subunit delta